MPIVKFYPTGNADTCFIQTSNGQRIIYDYANTFDPKDENDKRIDLEQEIRSDVGEPQEVDVFAISHLDMDHYKGASELFWLDHASKYQSDDRIKAKTLWVPAAAILEKGITDEGKILRAEARHRLKEGKGIRVFSNPNALDDWLEENDIDPDDRKDLITHAGELAPEFSLSSDGIEFFVHSPFSETCEDGAKVVRNKDALFMQVTFEVQGQKTYLILSADCHYEVLEAIVRVTKAHDNEDRLLWDINNVPHHCSYLSLAADKGNKQTIPSEDVKWLYENEEQVSRKGLLISTSNVIPSEETTQPPHKQAAEYYRSVVEYPKDEFLVTMEQPKPEAPEPIIIEVTRSGYKQKKLIAAAPMVITQHRAPRAG